MKDKEATTMLIQAFAATTLDLDRELRGVAELHLPQSLSHRDYTLQRLRAHLLSPLEGLPDTPENAENLHTVYLIVESFDQYLTRLDGT